MKKLRISTPYAILVSTSSLRSVNAFEKRNSVRETWQTFEQTHPVKIVFVLGLPPLEQTEELQKRLEFESRQHGDILQEGFVDTYQNLTLKSMFVLKFSVNFLQYKTDWIMAIDDDSYVNIPQLLSFLNTVPNPRKDIIGKVYSKVCNHTEICFRAYFINN